MDLKKVDIIALSQMDDHTQIVSPADPQSAERLLAAGLISAENQITKLGLQALATVRQREQALREGFPFTARGECETRRLLKEPSGPWCFAFIGKEQIVTNGELLYIGSPEENMNATRATKEFHTQIPVVIRSCASKTLTQVWPHTCQSFSLGGPELVWLASEDQLLMVPIQAKYYDYLFGRFPRATYWAGKEELPIQVKVKNRGAKDNILALVALFDVAGRLPMPRMITGWRVNHESVRREDVSAVGEHGGTV